FSSRRRHTISKRDWSSDVCSSDLRRILYSFQRSSHIDDFLNSMGMHGLQKFIPVSVKSLIIIMGVCLKYHRSFSPLISYGRSGGTMRDRKSTRLNSSHVSISYAVFCLTK